MSLNQFIHSYITKELLTEVSKGALVKNYFDKYVKFYNSSTTTPEEQQEAFAEFLDKVFEIDPTKNKEYARWLIEKYLRPFGAWLMEDGDKIKGYLLTFQNYKRNLPVKDIGQIKDVPALFNMLKAAGLVGISSKGINPAMLAKLEASGDIRKFGENNEWLGYIPLTERGSCAMGDDTEWCTAKYAPGHEHNKFIYYTTKGHEDDRGGHLYVLFNKTTKDPRKIQVHFRSSQTMNENDQEITLPESALEMMRDSDLRDHEMPKLYRSNEEVLSSIHSGERIALIRRTFDEKDFDGFDPNLTTKFRNCVFNGIKFPAITPRENNKNFFINCVFNNCTLAGSEKISFEGCIFENCILKGVFSGIDFDGCRFKNGCKFANVIISENSFQNCNMTDTKFTNFAVGGSRDTLFFSCQFLGGPIFSNLGGDATVGISISHSLFEEATEKSIFSPEINTNLFSIYNKNKFTRLNEAIIKQFVNLVVNEKRSF